MEILTKIEEHGLAKLDCNTLVGTGVSDEMDALWVKNYRENRKHYDIENTQVRSHPDPRLCILVGASPALNLNVEYLKDLPRDQFVIVSCAAALKTLTKHGIRPDYVMLIDAREHVKHAFTNVDTSGMTLVATPFVHPESLKHWKGGILWYVCGGGNKWAEVAERDFPVLELNVTGGNVTNTSALWAYRYLRARRFALIGMSLCYYYGSEYYCDGSKTISELERDRWEQKLAAMDIYGRLAGTTPSLLIYKTWLETYSKLMVEKFQCEFTNCTEDGIFGVLPQPRTGADGTTVFEPTYLPWVTIAPLKLVVEAHKERMNHGFTDQL